MEKGIKIVTLTKVQNNGQQIPESVFDIISSLVS